MASSPRAERRVDSATIWAEVGASIEDFVRRRIRDPHHADDVVAEVMLRVHEHVATLAERERVTAWVYRIARNAITDEYRRIARHREVLAAEPEHGPRSGADAWRTEETSVVSELAACVRPLVRALPGAYRRALERTDLEGLSQADAARLEGISLSGMKSRIQRGRRKFAALVEQCCAVTVDVRGRPIAVAGRPDGGGCPPPS